MADAQFDFDTKQVKQQVDSATKSLDLLVQKMKELDKTSLNQMQRELNNLKANGPEAIKGMIAGMKGSVKDMKNLLEEGLTAPMKSSKFREAFNGYAEQFRALTKRIEKMQQENSAAMLVEEQTAMAKRLAEQKRGMAALLNNAEGAYQKFNPKTGLKGSVVLPNLGPEIAKLQTDVEAFARIWERLGTLASGKSGLRLLSSNLHQDTALIQSELSKFYTRLQEDGERMTRAWARISNPENVKSSFRSLQATVAESSAAAKAELNKLYTELERVSNLKDQIKGRLASGNVGAAVTNSGGISTLDARDARYTQDMAGMKAYYTAMETGEKTVSKEMTNTNVAAKGLSKGMKDVTMSGNDLHSMARGLASGFNLLWLTWGNLVPLFVGAAISNGFMQTVKTGMEVAHTFEIIGALGGATAQEMGALSNELVRLGTNGIHGPKEIAEAMKTLTLAGLKANEVLSVTQSVLNFSVAGTTSLQTSAETLVSITTAFGTGAAGFGNAADIIVRAAADSKSSVESFGEALKTASVVGEQFGASLTDVAVQVEVLAQLGIQGSAAGTSIRNFYTDISGRTPKVVKALKELNVEFRDLETGNVKPLIENVKQLSDVMNTLTPVGGKNWLATVFSERGGKDAVALIVEYKKQIKDATGATLAWSHENNALAERLRAVENAAGDSAIAAARLAQTSKSEFAKVGATLQTTLFEAFKAIEPQLTVIFEGMRAAFASPEFLSGLTMMVSSIANLGKFLAEHAILIATIATAYGVMKVAMLADLALQALATAAKVRWTAATSAANTMLAANSAELAANTVATAANAAATSAGGAATAGKAAGLLGIARIMPALNLLITAGTVAWLGYELLVKGSSKADEDAAAIRSGAVVKSLKDEADKLEALNELRFMGLSATDAQLKLDAQKSKQTITDYGQEDQLKIEARLARLKSVEFKNENARRDSMLEINRLESERNSIVTKREKLLGEEEKQRQRVQNESNKAAQFNAADLKARAQEYKDATASITNAQGKGFQQQEFGGKGAGRASNDWAENFRINSDNALKEIEKQYNLETEMARKLNTTQQELNKARMEAGLITLGEYQAKELAMAQVSESTQMQTIAKTRAAYAAEFQKRKAEVQELKSDWESANAGNKAFDKKNYAALKTMEAELKKLTEAEQTFMKKLDDHEILLRDTADKRIELATISVGKAIKELSTEMEKLDREQSRRTEKQIRDQQLAIDSLTMTPRQIASVKAYNDELEHSNAIIEKYQDKLEEINKAYKDYVSTTAANNVEGPWSPEQLENAERFRKKIESLTEELRKYQEQGGLNATAAGDRAGTLFDKTQTQKTIKDVASAITDGLFKGGKEGSKKLREIITDKLKEPINLAINAALNVATNYVQGLLTGGSSSEGGASGGGLGSILSAGQSIWSALSGSMVSSLAGGIGQIGSMLGSSALSSFSAGMGGAASIAANSIAGSLGSAFATAMPWVAGIMAIYTLAKKFDKSGTPHTGGLAEYNSTTGLRTSQTHGAFGMEFGGVDANQGITDMVSGVAKGITELLDSTALAFGKTAGYTVATAFADDSSSDGSWGGLVISKLGQELLNWADSRDSKWAPRVFSDGEKGSKEYLAAISQSVMTVIKDMDLPGWATSMLDNLGDAPSLDQLATVMDQINQTHAALKLMGETLVGFAGMTDETTTALIAASGGISTLAANANAYYENFYSQAERTANSTNQLERAFSEAGLTMPRTREQFRSMLEAQIALGEDGAENTAIMLGLASAFAALVPATVEVENSAEALTVAIEGLRNPVRTIEDIARGIVDLEDQLFQAEHSNNLSALREREISSMTEAERALQRRIWALEDERKVTDQRLGLERQLLELNEDTLAIRALDLAALEPANRALQQHIWALEDQRAAAEAAEAALRSQVDEQRGLQRQLWEIEGNTAALREETLQGLLSDEARALQQRIWDAQDRKAADEAAARAAEDYRSAMQAATEAAESAAKAVKDAWKSIGNSIADEIKRIRGLLSSDPSQSLAAAQSEFAIATAKTRAGDQEAGKSLPGLSQSMLQLAEDNATSLAQLRIIQAQTAASLSQTNAIIASKYGISLPSFDVGTDYVPYDMIAQVHKGEKIVPAAYNPSNPANASSSGDTEKRLQALEYVMLSVASSTAETARIMRRWEGDSVPVRTMSDEPLKVSIV